MAIQEPLAFTLLPINKSYDWLEALPSRPALYFLLTCVGLALTVCRLEKGTAGWGGGKM